MNVVYITDQSYAMPTCVSITSLMENSYNPEMRLYVIADKISSDAEQRIIEASYGLATIIRIESDKYLGLIKDIRDFTYVSPTAMAKFELPRLLPDIDKVIYLDGDIIVQKSLDDLFVEDINSYYLAAVDDMGDERDEEGNSIDAARIGIRQKMYFNSGVLLLNLEKMRKDSISDRLLEYRMNGKNYFVDQDALNYVCAKKWKPLPFCYNFRSALFDTMGLEIVNERFYTRGYNSIESCIEDQAVLHISNRMKPWHYYLPWFTDIFLKYYYKSPYKNVELHLLSPVKAVYDERSDVEKYMDWRFPYDKISKGARIVLYGGGTVGTSLYNQNSVTGYCKIIAWVDKKKSINDKGFISPERIEEYDYDYLLVAVHDRIYANEIKKEIESRNIPTNKTIFYDELFGGKR